MKLRFSIHLIVTMAVVLGVLPVLAVAAPAQPPSPKIEAQLLDLFAVKGTGDYVVRFVDQADLSAAYTMGWHERGVFVVNTLKAVADRSQANAKALLDARGLKYQGYIAGNDMVVWAGDQASAEALAALPEVAVIRASRTYTVPKPEPGAAQPDEIVWSLIDTKADQFWGTFGVRGEGIVVANIDTGVDYTHPALLPNYKCGAGGPHTNCWYDPNTINCSGPGGGPCDTIYSGIYHGTHTMGTMAGDDDPGLLHNVGMAPNAQWIACLGLPNGSGTDADLNACADWMLAPGGNSDNRPDVVNNSWGGTPDGDPWYLPKVNAWRAAGTFPAFSAGNSGSACDSMGDPGSYQESFAAAAHDVNRNIAGFSSRGPSAFGHDPYTKPNISAPGVSVMSAQPNNGWTLMSGTSMASPHNAGAVALLWSCSPSLRGNIDATFQVLQNSADASPAGNCGAPPDGQGNYTFGYGYLNVLQAGLSACGGVQLGAIQGHVYDTGGNPIEGATVLATPAIEGGAHPDAITDPNGYYTMTVAAGTYDVTASMAGYQPQTVTGIVVGAGQVVTQDFNLAFLGLWVEAPATCFDLYRIDSKFYAGTGLIYILGGRTSSTATTPNIYSYNPATGECLDTGADMPEPISNYTINIVNDGTKDVLCTFGGRNGDTGVATLAVQCYDPIANTAAIVTQLPPAYTGFTPGGQAVVDNMVYVFGGFRNTAAPYELARTDRYDPVANTFTQVGDLTQARSYLDVAVVDGAIYAFGGTVFDGANLTAQTRAEMMADPGGAGTWNDAAVADLPTASAEGRAFGFDTGTPYGLENQIVIAGGGQWPAESADVILYDVASDTYDTAFPDLNIARRDHGGTFVPLTSDDPSDGLPAMWVFGGRSGSDEPPYAVPEYYPMALVVQEPDIEVTPSALSQDLCPDATATVPLTICNVGTLPLDWSLSEVAVPNGSPFVPVNVKGSADKAPITAASPAQPAGKVQPAANPEDVLWDQPLSATQQGAYVNQDFPDFPTYSSWLADDFVSADTWEITNIFVPGDGWNGFASLFNATALTWQIYADDGTGYPDGDPSGGGNPPVWTLTLLPTDGQVVISNGTPGGLPSNTLLNLAAPFDLPAGHWWFIFYPSLGFASGGQYGRQPADTTNNDVVKFINPGGAFGYGSTWIPGSTMGFPTPDMAFRIEGFIVPAVDYDWLSEDPTAGTVPPGECTVVDVTFDSTGKDPGEYLGALLIESNDPDEPEITIPVTMTVLTPVSGADFLFSPADPVVAETVYFSGTIAAGDGPFAWAWDFGDGGTGTGQYATHAYAAAGDFPVTLTVTGACGESVVQHTVTVVTGCDAPFGADFTFDPVSPFAGDTVTFVASVGGGTPPFTYNWTFSDGGTATGDTVTHVFATAGTFTAQLTVSNACGETIATHEIVVAAKYFVYLPITLKQYSAPAR